MEILPHSDESVHTRNELATNRDSRFSGPLGGKPQILDAGYSSRINPVD